jgi:iron complex outermembrane receptor protein
VKHKRYGRAALIAAASAGSAFMLGSGGAQAQQTQAQMLLEEVVVTARRREESLQDLPLSIAAFNAAQMEAQGLQSIEDVGDFVPNVTLTQSDRANNTRVIIRGIGGGHPDPVEVFGAGMYIDGHYVPNSLGGYLSTMDIERVEVLRGPQGTLFGKNVTGGAVNIISAKPGPDFDARASLRMAEDGEQNIRGSINFPISDTVFARLGAASEQFDGYYYNRHLNRDVDSKDATTINAAIRWQPNDNWTIDVNSFLVSREDGNLGTQCSDLGPTVTAPGWGGQSPNSRVNRMFPGADQAYHDACNGDAAISEFVNSQDKITFSNIDQQSLFATAQWDSGGAVGGLDNLMVKMTGSYRFNDYDYLQDRDASFLAIDAVGTKAGNFDVGQDNTTRGFEFLVEAQVNDRLEFTTGVNYFYEKAKNGDGNCRNEWVSDPSNLEILVDANGIPILDAGGGLQAANPGRFVDCASTSGLFFEILGQPNTWGGGTLSFLNTEYVENESLGVFGHMTYTINDLWTLDAGLRWTEDDRQFWNMEFSGSSDLSTWDQQCVSGTLPAGSQTLGDPSTTGLTSLCPGFVATADWTNTVGEGLFNSRSETFDDVTPMISLTRSLNPGDTIEDGMVYFLYSEGFLTGGFNVELNANLPAASALQVYDPEHVKNYEVGFKGTFADGRVRINADVFIMDYADKQAGVEIPNPDGRYGIDDPLGIRQNVGQVDISGIEFELRASPWDGGFISVDLGMLNNEYGEYSYRNPTADGVLDPSACGIGDAVGDICDLSNVTIVDLTPDYTLNIGIEHQFNLSNGATLTPRLNMYSSGEIEYQERRLDEAKTPCTQPSYTKVGARLTYEPAGANWRATVFGENITDESIFEACTDSRAIWRYRHERPAYWGFEFAAYFGNN